MESKYSKKNFSSVQKKQFAYNLIQCDNGMPATLFPVGEAKDKKAQVCLHSNGIYAELLWKFLGKTFSLQAVISWKE